MPQFHMVLLTESQISSADVLEHSAGSPVREGGGDETYRCGSCRTKLLVNVPHHDAHGVVIRCGKCRKLNGEPPHSHHHHP